MTETQARPVTARTVLGLIGLAAMSAVFLGGMFIGMSIDPRVDMTGRLTAYTVGLGGLAGMFACRWVLATRSLERIVYGGLAGGALGGTIAYGILYLGPHL